MTKWTYKDAGIDVPKIKYVQNALVDMFSQTLSFRKGFGSSFLGAGHYAGLLRLENERLLAIHTDNVGTKVLVAQAMKKFDTIGIDCVAMNVNDIICVGAEPFAMVDYVALREINESLLSQIAKGLAKGAKIAEVAIVGGETAILPDLLAGDKNAFDLAGTCVGFVDEEQLILGQKLKKDDAIIGIESSGIHSNGLTLARKVLLSKYSINEKIPGTRSKIGEELLRPTKIYCREILSLMEQGYRITGLAHITGGAFTKLPRISPNNSIGFSLENMPPPPEVFYFIQNEGRISKYEMYRTFNMGVGFCVFAPKRESKQIVKTLQDEGIHSSIIGRVIVKPGVFLDKQPL